MASRRESRSAVTGVHTLQEFENLRRSFKASNDRLARKNNELLAQITLLNNQLQECAAENFRLRGEVSTLQRNVSVYQARASSFERERQTMLDLMDEVNRANEWTRKNLTSLRRSFDLVDTPEPTTTASAQKPPTARQSIHSVVGVSKPPDMSRITEGGSESHGSPHASPAPLNVHPPLSTLDARPTSMPAVKARDSLSLTYSDTPVAPGRRTVRRLSGRLPALDPTSHVRSSPPRSPPRNGTSNSANVRKLIGGTEFMPDLSPLAIQLDDDVANNAPHGKEKGRLRRKSPDFSAQSQPSQRLDQPDSSLNDVTNASPTARKSTVMSTKEAAMDGADPVIVPPTPVRERQAKKPQLSTPSLAEDLLKHGSSSESSSRANRPANSVPAGSLAPPRSSKNRSSSPADPAGKSETEATSEEEGRERRVRKTINYAEPKLNTKMRKPDGWDSKNRKSLALTPVTNSAAPAQSSASVQVSAGVTLRKHRPTSYPPAITVNQRSSSPLGDIDEPHSTVGRTYTSSKVPRKNLVDDLEDDGEASSYRSRLGERKEEMHLGVPKTSSKPTPRGEETEPNETWSVLSSDFAPSGLNTLARKRKTPSYSSSGPPAVTTSDDDDERASDDDDGDEYVDNHRRATFKKNPSVRRQSGALSKRHL